MARTSLFPSALCALVAASLPYTAQAQDSGPTIDFYGHINMGVIVVDDGHDTETSFTDNDNSNSRIGLWYKQGLANGAEFKLNFETGLGLSGTSSITRGDDNIDFDFRRTELRKFEMIYHSPLIGTFSLGQGSTATDGFAEADFSGTGLVSYSSITDLAGSQQFRDNAGADFGSIGSAFGSFDGARRFRVRYDTPTYNGIGVAVSAGQEVLVKGDDNDYYDVGLKYDTDYSGVKISGRLGYSFRDNSRELLVGSVALLHTATGLNLAVAAGSQEKTGDADYYYVKGGIKRDWFAIGETAFSLDYYKGDDFIINGSDSKTYSIAAVQKLDEYNLELYAVYRRYELDDAGARVKDLDATFVGARWKF